MSVFDLESPNEAPRVGGSRPISFSTSNFPEFRRALAADRVMGKGASVVAISHKIRAFDLTPTDAIARLSGLLGDCHLEMYHADAGYIVADDCGLFLDFDFDGVRNMFEHAKTLYLRVRGIGDIDRVRPFEKMLFENFERNNCSTVIWW